MERKDFLKKIGFWSLTAGSTLALPAYGRKNSTETYHHQGNVQPQHDPVGPIGLFDLTYTLDYNLNDPTEVRKAWDQVHTTATLQGIVNREAPKLYLFFVKRKGTNIDRYWWEKYRKGDKWLSGYETQKITSVPELVRTYRSEINGAVIYDPKVAATSNVASAIAGAANLIAVRYDPTEGSLYSRVISNGPKVPANVWLLQQSGESMFSGAGNIPGTNRKSSGSAKNDAYLWFLEHYMKKGKYNPNYGAYYIDQQWMNHPNAAPRNHHTLTNHDFFVSRNAFFFDLSPWSDEPATDDPNQPVGTDVNTLKELLENAYDQYNGDETSYIGGFPPWAFKYTDHVNGTHGGVPTEWKYTKIISAYNGFQDADAIGLGALANASFWQHFPLKEKYPQVWTNKNTLKKQGYLTTDGKVNFDGRTFIIFYVGDYDSSSWVSQTTPGLWDDPDRGEVPLMWCISPVLEERVPMALHYRRETATKNDYFAAADNGAGYLNPGMLQEPRPISGLESGLDAWKSHCKPYYRRWDLSITGFIIDGYGPALNDKGLKAYASFSPNGIVPNKRPPTLLYDNMPVLLEGPDINDDDPSKAAQKIVKSVNNNRLAFQWFRNILKSPSWYKQVVGELSKLDSSIELVEGPTFFELYRIYLKNHPIAAVVKSNV